MIRKIISSLATLLTIAGSSLLITYVPWYIGSCINSDLYGTGIFAEWFTGILFLIGLVAAGSTIMLVGLLLFLLWEYTYEKVDDFLFKD